jgi:dienelactone hydrolase
VSKQTPVPLEFEGEELEGVMVSRRDGQARPTVMLIPTVMGVSDLELGFAKQLVELGYNAFVADIFGKKFRSRLLAIVEQVRGLPQVEGGKLVVAGYCFGGKCALDLARTGTDIKAAVAFHGLLDPPNWPTEKTSTKVVVFHGWDDPMAPPEHVVALAKELTDAGADWQIHAFGNVRHGFTNPNAHKIGLDAVRYDELAAERSWTSFINLLEETFG